MAPLNSEKVTHSHFGRGHRNKRALAVAFARSFIAEEEKRAISTVVELGYDDRTTDGHAEEVGSVGDQLLAKAALEEEVGVNRRIA
jgi:predicted hydrolase (HD superfamily)